MDDLREIVRRVGGQIYAGGRAAVVPGPGHSKRDRSLSLRLEGDRVIFYSFANDSCRDILAHLGLEARHSQEASPSERARLRKLREEEERRRAAEDRAFCQSVWSGTVPIYGTAAEAYLWSRGLILDEDCGDVRFHPEAPRGKPRPEGEPQPRPPHPAMVALVRGRDDAPLGLHVTYVRPDGSGKAFGNKSRLMFGPIRGGAVHLCRWAPDLAIAEGIETALAYRARSGAATWAALSTSGLANFQLPPRTRRLLIAADGDEAGLRAATQLAERAQRVCDVEVQAAPTGKDWADVWEGANV